MRSVIFLMVVCCFYSLFLKYDTTAWSNTYSRMGVPANSYPGGDSRNIQLEAYCSNEGYQIFSDNECIRSNALLKNRYEEVNIPKYNYPSIWVDIYNQFYDYDEKSFKKFWRLNAILLLLALVFLAVKYNIDYMFIALFSPIVILTVERGNVDGIILFLVVFFSYYLSKAPQISSFFLIFSSALKLYPIVVLPIIFFQKVKKRFLFFIFLALGGGLLFNTLKEIKYFVNGTPIGFEYSYGIATLGYSELIVNYSQDIKFLIIGLVLFGIFGIFCLIIKYGFFKKDILLFVDKLSISDVNLLYSTLSIYIFTFLFFGNWAYRYIFIIPLFFVISKEGGIFFNALKANIFLILWVTFLNSKSNLILINLLSYPLFILSFVLYYYLILNKLYPIFLNKTKWLKNKKTA